TVGDGGTLFTMRASVYEPRSTNKTETASEPDAGQPTVSTNAIRVISPWSTNCPAILPQITVAAEHYNRLVRMIQQGEKLKMTVDLAADYNSNDLMCYNTIAEIPGTDKSDEVVMLGAHMDSWHSGTGATDNGAGV